jgi:hypothetical protein
MFHAYLLLTMVGLFFTSLQGTQFAQSTTQEADVPAQNHTSPFLTPWGPLPELITKQAADALYVAKLQEVEDEYQKKLDQAQQQLNDLALSYRDKKTNLHLRYSSLMIGALLLWGIWHKFMPA